MRIKRGHLLPLIILGLFASPLLAVDYTQGDGLILFGGVLIITHLVFFVIEFFFLLSQSAMANAMQTSDPNNNTSGVWRWTQLIPIWTLIATPVVLVKLSNQFSVYVRENDLNLQDVKPYSSTWGWVWYAGTIGSAFYDAISIVALVGFIVYWVHIYNVKNSLVFMQATVNNNQPSDSTH